MTYSVWNPATKTYSYYETSEGFVDDPPKPKKKGGTALGVAPGQLTYALPAGAVKTGEGCDAMGVVIHPPPSFGGLPSLGFFEVEAGWLMLVVGGYFVWKYLPRMKQHKILGKKL